MFVDRGDESLSSADIFWTGEGKVFQMRTSALFAAKNCGFFGIYGELARTKGVEPVTTFCKQEVNFLRFCADVFYGRSLT